MRSLFRNILLLPACFSCSYLYAQVKLKNRTIIPSNNIDSFSYAYASGKQFNGKIFCILNFNHIVTAGEKQQLSSAGIELYQYIPDNTFTAVITRDVSGAFLAKLGAHSIFELSPQDKLSKRLIENNIPSWAVKQPNTVDVIVHFSKGITPDEAESYFLGKQYPVVDKTWSDYHFITLRAGQQNINELAAIPFVEYIEPVAPDPKTFNYLMRSNTRANVLNAPASEGGEGLSGRGVTIGIGDDADPSGHVDLYDRVINRAAGLQQTHGTHVAGIAAGGGLKDPLFQGVAPQATIIAQLFNGIFLNAGAYIADYRMVVTNNSWGNITGECDLAGVYDTYSKLIDDISVQYPYLLHVFAAGNDGPFTCNGFPQQYHTIVSGHQSAKNVLSVGWGEKNMTVSTFSSIGPAADGRLKPEITSQGSGLRSTAPGNDYFTDWGTSMAAPTVAGGAALLIEKYRQMNSGNDPKSGLIKALLMNGARDIENPAPDHKSGYGFLNLVRSIDILKNNRYLTSNISNGLAVDHSITVPAGLSQLKVMIYWHDPSAAIFAQQALVNDIDLELITPPASVVLPWRLSSDSNNATANATRAADHLNNSEQVTIDNPVAGNYTIRIKGSAINTGPSQEYFIVYDYVPTGVYLTYPAVGEPLVPGESIVIQWDSWGGPNNDFTIEYSVDNALTWNSINSAVPANARQYTWTVPSLTSDKAKIRITKNGTAFSDESRPFVIVSQPQLSLAAVQCEGYAAINGAGVGGATDYEVMMKRGTEMIPVAITANTNYIFTGLNRDSTYWFTVRARINGNPGRRAVAVSRKPDNGTCAGNLSDNDLELDSIISPVTGRKFTSTGITTTTLSVRVKNLDDAPVTGFTIKYSINGSSFSIQNIAATIPSNGSYIHSFTGVNFATAGLYDIIVAVKNNAPDANAANDTFRTIIKHLPNAPVSLPYTENFEAAPVFEITKDITGLPGLDRWDFMNSTDTGRIRSFVNTGIAKSGNRAITLDTKQYISTGNTNYFIGTFNLSNVSGIFPDELGLKLEFSYKHHGQKPHPDNRVWARRSDTDPWIQVFNLDSISLRSGEWKTVLIDLSKTPAALLPTSSFQVRFGQHGNFIMGDDISGNGITIDDVALLAAPSDVQIIAVDSPLNHSCDLSASVPLKIRFATSRIMPGCIPVKYQLDNGPVIAECAPAASNAYTFNSKLNLSSFGPHVLNVWLDDPGDNYKKNDSIRNYIIYNKPVVNIFPYLENFEHGTGNWHTEGYRSSWEYGTPASLKIRTAASGTKAWKTKLNGQYNENESSYLYSPCFDVSSLPVPFLSFSMALDIEQCGVFVCDKLWIEYSADYKTWIKLGSYGQGINWYNNKMENVWDSAGFTNWHVTGITLPTGLTTVQFRFVLQSDAGVTREGVAIDDVQVYNKQANAAGQWMIYPNPVNSILQVVSIHETNQEVDLQVYDALGRRVLQQSFVASGFLDKNSLSVSRLAKGIYALKISDGVNTRTFKLVKQ
jgi:hypothetical protein